MQLYGQTPSPFFCKCHIVLEEKGLQYETVDCLPFPKTPALLALHPLGKIPILKTNDLTIPDSSVICAYLEKIQPQPALYPEDPAEFAHALFLEEYADTEMSNVIQAGIFFERFAKPKLFQQETDEAWGATLINDELPPILDYTVSNSRSFGTWSLLTNR